MQRRILTLDDLYNFYFSKGKTTHFNAKNDGDRIIVRVDGSVNFQKKDEDTEGLCPVILQSCHISDNINGSYISEESMKMALPSFSNRPILGYIYQDKNGDYQFKDHTMHIDDDGELVYDEVPVGIIPESCNAHLEYDKEKEKTYVVVDGYIFEEYSKAHEIIDRDGECSVSVELCIRELSYDSQKQLLNIENFFFSGVTILGRWEDGSEVKPGMQGSNIRISDFKQRNNTTFSQDNVIAMLNEINKKIDQLSINNLGKEEIPEMNFEENVEVTETENIEDVSADEVTGTEEANEVEETETEEFTKEETVAELQDEEHSDVAPSEEFENNEENDDRTVNMSVVCGDHTYETFASLSDILYGLTTLVNDTYSDDNTWYSVDAYDDGSAKSRYVIMVDMFTGKGFKQSYQNKDGILSLKGDRVPVTSVWVTDTEKAELEKMRANYAEVSEKLAKYEAEPEKLEILNSADYSSISDSEEFVAFKAQDAHFDMSVEDVRAKADEMLLNAAKSGKVDFAAQAEKKEIGMKKLPINKQKKQGRYGGLFTKN